jgi:cytochrome c553
MNSVRPALVRRSTLLASVLICVLCAHDRAEAAGGVKAGCEKAQKCEACHGLYGLAKIAKAPNIARQSERYLTEELNEFHSGERNNEMMSIEDLAAYYSAIQISVGKIPSP